MVKSMALNRNFMAPLGVAPSPGYRRRTPDVFCHFGKFAATDVSCETTYNYKPRQFCHFSNTIFREE